jgi:hypothetical protein
MLKRIVCAVLLSVGPAAAAPVNVGFAPPAQFVPVGSTANVQLVISGLGNHAAPSLGDYDVLVAFDPNILGSPSVTFGDPVLGDQLDLFRLGNVSGSQLMGPGSLHLFEISLDAAADLDSLQPASFTLATLHFQAIGTGTSTLSLQINSLGDANGNPLAGVSSTATVTTVPEPAGLWLLGAALCGVCGRRRGFGSGRG